ncbi:MAG: cytochrome c-type biogenesis protein CcmH [Acidobacteria bacterium]|nr:cytochrome c-type biogenesis protein CcmH [Acidobacteriota bacterium]
MLRVWNVTLVIMTFFLTIFGTFMTRSGVVQSVHAFGEDRQLAYLFTGFMVVILTFSFGLVIWRLPLLRSRHELDSWVSREAAFLANNWILLFSAFFVLFATMFPTLSEAVTGERLTVGPPFFTKWMMPVGLALLVLTGIGPQLAWRKSTLTNLRDSFMWPTLAGVVTAAALAAVGLRVWSSGLCFALCAFVMVAIVQEFWRGANVRRGATGTDFLTALIGLVGRNKRRYGGYIVHVGIVLMFFGFAGNGYKRDEQVLLKLGQEVTVGSFTIRNERVNVSDDGQKQMTTAYLAILEDGKQIDTLYPAKWAFRKHEQEPTTEVAIRRSIGEDLYIVLAAYDLSVQSASLQIVVNPLVNWIWFGFGMLALGTGIALLPERAYSFALAKMPADAVTTAGALLLAFVLLGTPLYAQGMGGGMEVQTSFYARTPFEREMQHEIRCTCGACGHASIGECRKDPCATSHKMRGELAVLIDQNKSRDEIIQWFITTYDSQEMLGAPLDKGFNRLAWLLPWAVGATGAIMVGFAAIKWSRRGSEAGDEQEVSEADEALDQRLDDELRNLD